ncbi:MAG: xanthine dehydrogenase family protein molybdopterin-binding subunit [Gemmatimonadetes bacterium]|nr:xanthine dehydrogenase family protein molybdopterin-binding subunit [Gemmatimonadota bacterium]
MTINRKDHSVGTRRDLVSRRDFLRVTAAVGGGLVLTVALPGCRPKGGGAASIDPFVFVRLNPDNTVAITIAKSEMGQGVRTSLAMLVAEELDADWNQVRVEQASFDPKYGDMGTGGSGSVRDNWTTLREAGAALRTMLVATAAKEWGVTPSECRTENSFVHHDGSGRKVHYGALAEAAAGAAVPKTVELKPKARWTILGKDRGGIDVGAITHGTATFGMDFKVPGMLYASIERTAVFGGRVKRVDATAALAVPGVKQVVEIEPVGNDVNVHAGVAVVADNTWAALQGRKALVVEWDPGPHAGESSEQYRSTMGKALDQPGQETVNKIGDPDAVLAKAGSALTATYEAPFLSHATMEPMNCTASVKGTSVEVWSPTQFPDWAARSVAEVLGVDIKNVQVHVTLMGGGFGRRINPDFSVEAALVSRKVQQPVKVVWTREDDLGHDFYRPCALHRIDASLGADGFPEAWRHRISTPSIDVTYGPKPKDGWGPNEADGSGNMSYRIPNRSCEYTLLDSAVPRGWWRAVSTTHGVFAVESMIDELAAAAGKDPVEFRLALIDRVTVAQPADSKRFPFNHERLKGVVQLAADKAGWGRQLPPGHAMGIACGYDHLGYAAEVFEVSVQNDRLRIHRVVCAADAGPVVNPNGARAQLEGGVIQGLSAALRERVTIEGGRVVQRNFDGYRLLRINEAPVVLETYFVETDTHPTGFGEPAVPPVAAGLANAIFRATGKRLRSLPLEIQLG